MLVMTEQELWQQRQARWRVDGTRPVQTIEAAAEFLAEVGLCLEFPVKPAVVAPTWIGACAGMADDLPVAKQACRDRRVPVVEELKRRLLRLYLSFAVRYLVESNLLVVAGLFRFFYSMGS